MRYIWTKTILTEGVIRHDMYLQEIKLASFVVTGEDKHDEALNAKRLECETIGDQWVLTVVEEYNRAPYKAKDHPDLFPADRTATKNLPGE